MFFGFSKNIIQYVHLINRTITIKLYEPQFDLCEISYTFDTHANALMNLDILIEKYDLKSTELIHMYVHK